MDQTTTGPDEDLALAPEGVSQTIWDSWGKYKELPSDDFLAMVRRGINGENVGLGNGLKRINNYLYGTHTARYYLIGADSGVGKTTIADFMYVLSAFESAKASNKKLKIFYCSFEISKSDKMARWVAHYAFVKFGFRMPSDYILGRVKGKLLSDEHQKIVLQSYTFVEELMKCVHFISDIIHPTAIFEGIIEHHYEKIGTVLRDELNKEEEKKGKRGYVRGYRANNGSDITVLMVDHLALAGTELHLDTKGIMDKLSKYAVVLRNIFHTTCVFIQQFSTDLMSWHRTQKKNPDSIIPQRIDFGDSKATFRDADVVLGLIKPSAFDYEEFKGYPILKRGAEGCLGSYFIACCIMKNRYGPSGKMLPLFLDPIAGVASELPDPTNLFLMDEFFKKHREIENTICQYFPKEN